MRAERPEDRSAVAAVHRAAFGGPAEAELVEAVRASDRFEPELSLVADLDGEVVGHVLLSSVDVVEERPGRVLVLAPAGVAPEHQGRGIGSALVRSALAAAAARGEPLVVLEGAPAYYRRFGFRPASEVGIAPPGDVPDAVFQAVVLSEQRSPVRGRLVYPPAFEPVL